MLIKSQDPLSKAVAQFNEGRSSFDSDEPILGVDQINRTLDKAEEKYTTLITAAIAKQFDSWWQAITPALDLLDKKKIEKQSLNLSAGIQGVLLGGWREIFSTGSREGVAEVNEVGLSEKEKSPEGLFNGCNVLLTEFDRTRRGNGSTVLSLEQSFLDSDRSDYLAEFASIDRSGIDKFIKKKPAFEVAYPPDQADLDVLSVDELREALNTRTQVLADDLSQEVNDKIARVIKDSVDLHYVEGKEVQRLPLASRTKIRNKINGIIGYERQKQKSQGVPEAELPRTKLGIPGRDEGTVVNRAKMIASTELNAGYNLGRLQSYARAGVTSVRWQAIGDRRTCKICQSRMGLVLPLEEVLRSGVAQARSKSKNKKFTTWQYIIPAHPFCRCAWQIATKEEAGSKARAAVVTSTAPLAKTWALVGSAAKLTSAIGVTGSVVNTASAITREKQLQEKARNRAKNRTTVAIGGALSLGVLSLGLWSWLNRTKQSKPLSIGQETTPIKISDKIATALDVIISEETTEKAIASTLTKTQGDLAAARQKRELELARVPLTPEMLMKGRKVPRLSKNLKFVNSGVDLKTISDTQLRIQFELLPADIAVVRGLTKQYQSILVKTSPFQRLLPAAAISPLKLAKYPWLADVKDIRDLNIRQMLKKGIPETEALQIYNTVYRRTRSSAGIAQVSKEERDLLRRVNSVTTKEELAGLLQLTRNQTKIVNSLFAKLERYKAQGKKIQSVAELRLRGVGDKTVARMLAEAKGKLRINEILMSSDRALALERLQTIAGVGSKTAEAIYESLLDSGVQFLDADDMIRRIEPFMKMRGLELSARVKKALSNRLDFVYYPGLDRQTLPPQEDFPRLPGFDPRGDIPLSKPLGTTTNPSDSSSTSLLTNTSSILINSPTPRLLKQTRDKSFSTRDLKAIEGEAIAYSQNHRKTLAREIKQSKATPISRKDLGTKLIEAEKKLSTVLQKNNEKAWQVQYTEATELVKTVDQSILDLEIDIKNSIADPLTVGAYSNEGRLSFSYRDRINQSVRQIEIAIKKIDSARGLSLNERTQVKRLKKELDDLKRQAFVSQKAIVNDPLSLSSLERQKAISRTQDLIDQHARGTWSGNPTVSAHQIKSPVDNTILLETIKKTLEDGIENPVAWEIDDLLKKLDDFTNVPSGTGNNIIREQLLARKKQLQELRDRRLEDDKLKLNRQTIAQRKELVLQNRRLSKQSKQFEQQYLDLEQSFNKYREVIDKQIAMGDPEAIAINKQLSIDQAQSRINQRAKIIENNQRDLDLLKSDRWQQYATSVANLEDMASGSSLGNNYLSFEELVNRRNGKLNQAAGEIKRNAKEITAWADNPENILRKQLIEVEDSLNKLSLLQVQQQRLANLGAQITDELPIQSIAEKTVRYQEQIIQRITQLEQAKQNLKDAIAHGYKFNAEKDTPNRIKNLAQRSITRAEKRLVKKDKAKVTSVLDLVDKAGLDVTEMINSAKTGKYTPLQSKVINSLSPQDKKSFELAIKKGVLELNQDIRVMEHSRDFLNSVVKDLRSQKKAEIASIANNISIRGTKKVKLIERLQSALEKNDFVQASKIAEGLSAQEFKQVKRKIAKITEIVGTQNSSLEINILAGVRPSELPREQFLNLVKGNTSLTNLYNLTEIEQAIALNKSGIKRAEDRLAAVNFG